MFNIFDPLGIWGGVSTTDTVGGGAASDSKMPWYITFGLVIIGGFIVFYAGKKVVDKFIK